VLNPDERGKVALIITHNRPELLARCIEMIRPQVGFVLVIDNASDPPAVIPEDGPICLMQVPDQPPNLAALWNKGWEFFKEFFDGQPYDVAMICDDVTVPPGWFDAIVAAMRETGAATGCSNPWGVYHEPRVKHSFDNDISGRMTGAAYIIDGTKGIVADERMRWWWQDTDIDMQARQAGGMVMIGGYQAVNTLPNEYTTTKPELGAQAGQDGNVFAEKWGSRPW
jgi:glycosyltransferase involved in cell wall biosynthesis